MGGPSRCPVQACLVHEADLVRAEFGTEGTGMTWVEHRQLQRDTPLREANSYANCVYSCRFCNRARSVAELEDEGGRRILDPRSDIWADHFSLVDDEIVEVQGDVDAQYTW